MMLERKTPKARKEARSYCRRCLAVMLCCVLAFGLTVRVTPKAEANTAVGTITLIGTGSGGGMAAGALGSNPVGATICGLLLVAAGVPFMAGYTQSEDSVFYGTALYDLGDNCYDDLYSLGGDIGNWLMTNRAFYENKGGVAPGDKIEVPAFVAEAVRQWAGTNLDFSGGICTYDQAAMYTTEGDCFVLSEVDFSGVSNFSQGRIDVPLIRLGTPLRQESIPLTEDNVFSYSVGKYLVFTQTFKATEGSNGYFSGAYTYKSNFYEGSIKGVGAGGTIASISFSKMSGLDTVVDRVNDYFDTYPYTNFLCYNRTANRIYVAECGPMSGEFGCRLHGYNYIDVSQYKDMVLDVPSTFTKTPALDEAKTQDIAVTVPADIPTTQVGDVSVPVIGALNPEDVLVDGTGTGTGEGDIDKPVPDVTPWDKILEGLDGIGAKIGTLTELVHDGIVSRAASGAVLGDLVINDTMDYPDDLGAVMITKFPFSIPWDITKAIELLAAPPTPPKWEVDLFGPLQGQWGFHSDETALVIDFERLEPLAVVVRWVSTVMFVYALASATKRFIWTA